MIIIIIEQVKLGTGQLTKIPYEGSVVRYGNRIGPPGAL